MRVSQRNTTFTSPASGAYLLDRWLYGKTGTMAHTVTQGTDVPTVAQSGYLYQNCVRYNLTTAQTSIAAGDFAILQQRIEGYNWAALAQKDFTVSFWVKATLPGTYCISLANSTPDRSYIAEYTINAAATWEKKTINITASPSAGTWNYTNGIGLRLVFTIAAGTSFQTTAGAWQTGNLLSTSNQVNGVNTGATDFRITGVMINEGMLTDPSFTMCGRSFPDEFQLCQRYYEKSYDMTSNPGTVTTNGAVTADNEDTATSTLKNNIYYKAAKRSNAPTITYYNPSTGASGTWSTGTPSTQTSGENCIGYNISIAGSGSTTGHWTSEAEL